MLKNRFLQTAVAGIFGAAMFAGTLSGLASVTFAGTDMYGDTGVASANDTRPFVFESPNEAITINITNTAGELVDVVGEKFWEGDQGLEEKYRPEQVTVHLYADGKDTEKSTAASQAKGWKYSFTDLEKYSDEGEEIVYTVKEDPVPGYSASYSEAKVDPVRRDGVMPTGTDMYGDTGVASANNARPFVFNEAITINITNTFNKEYVNVQGHKYWKGDENKPEMRPDQITIRLYADGNDTGRTVTAGESDGWTYAFLDCLRYDYSGDGHEIEYSVREENVPEGYRVTYTKVEPNYDEVYDSIKVTFKTDELPEEVTNTFDSIVQVQLYRSYLIGNHPAVHSEREGGTLYVLAEIEDGTVEEITSFTKASPELNKYNKARKVRYTYGLNASCTGYAVEVTGSAEEGFVVHIREKNDG